MDQVLAQAWAQQLRPAEMVVVASVGYHDAIGPVEESALKAPEPHLGWSSEHIHPGNAQRKSRHNAWGKITGMRNVYSNYCTNLTVKNLI